MRSKDVALDDTEAWPSTERGHEPPYSGQVGVPAGAVIGGRYRVRSLLGLGGMGAVYEGEQIELRKRVAIKLIAPELEAAPDALARFRRESRAASLAESENIVQVFDSGHDELWGFYLVMELLRGEDLGATLERRHKLPIDEALGIALQVARGLGKAHEAGVIHRDLKPENIFLVPREEGYPLVKIVDFGISKVFENATGVTEVTKQGTVIGTLHYMSPEQARGEEVDGRTDLWALGCVLYEMLTGEHALGKEQSIERTFMRLVQKGAHPIREVAPHLDGGVVALVNQMLAFEPKARIATARELTIRIARLRSQVSGTVSVHTLAAPRIEEVDDDPTLVGTLPSVQAARPLEPAKGKEERREPRKEEPKERVDPASIRAARLLIARAAVNKTPQTGSIGPPSGSMGAPPSGSMGARSESLVQPARTSSPQHRALSKDVVTITAPVPVVVVPKEAFAVTAPSASARRLRSSVVAIAVIVLVVAIAVGLWLAHRAT